MGVLNEKRCKKVDQKGEKIIIVYFIK